MLSLRELERAARLLEGRIGGARLDKLVQPDDVRLVLSFRDGPHVLLSCRPGSARLSVLPERPRAPRTPPPFVAFLRKHLGRATCTGVHLVGGDRQAALTLRASEGEFDLLLSILGPRSNLYLLDAGGTLRQALRPLAKTRRSLALGEAWRQPETPPPGAGGDRWADVDDAGFFAAVEAWYGALEGRERAEDLARRLGQALAREGRALERKRAALAGDLERAGEAQAERRRGELLKAALDRVQPGASQVEVEDWESGERVAIPLDPALSPRENLEAFFRRYRKRTRAVEPLERQLAELDARLAESRRLTDELAGADAEALEALAARPPLRKLLDHQRPPPRPQAARRELPARLVPRRYRTAGGLEVWVGRSDEGNDYLTTRLARGNDLFLHLEGSPGSHVVLRTEGRRDPPSEALLDAAELAVHFSKQRDATRADVHVVPIKNVRKPRGAKPGLVSVTGGRSLRLRRDPARLARVLDARIEEA